MKATRTRSNRGVNYLFDYAFDGGWLGSDAGRRRGAISARYRVGGRQFCTGGRRWRAGRLTRERRGANEEGRRHRAMIQTPVETVSHEKICNGKLEKADFACKPCVPRRRHAAGPLRFAGVFQRHLTDLGHANRRRGRRLARPGLRLAPSARQRRAWARKASWNCRLRSKCAATRSR